MTELNIETLVEKAVTREVERTDIQDMVACEVKKIITTGVGKEIIATIKEASAQMIQDEVRRVLDGEVVTDDGWGKREVFPSFEDLFRKQFKKAMDERYEVKKEIEKQVNARVQQLVKQDYSKVIEKIVDELSCSRLIKPDSKS